MTGVNNTIRLGGREFYLRPLTLGELRPVLDALDAAAGASGGALIDAAARVIQAGLAAAHPELGVEDILALEASLDEANAAVAAILGAAGLMKLGEARPAATETAGPRSPASTAPSSPGADTSTARSTA